MSTIKCKQCRKPICSAELVTQHNAGQGQQAFQYRKRSDTFSTNYKSNESTCHQIFLENLDWLTLDEVEGKINCIHCKAKLGSYHLAGVSCNCGSWIAPGFGLSKSKIDII
ncbi:hypothetical protein BC833DRAFT_626707 [Globomyces pollinis-pini]|nr:hypothetical protein BC833DRAFT_626707 [Globomyces pollinis-pini]KAJ2992247.1 hypothetical protein HDV02_003178 [Globomyces sp. JEL0801]